MRIIDKTTKRGYLISDSRDFNDSQLIKLRKAQKGWNHPGFSRIKGYLWTEFESCFIDLSGKFPDQYINESL